MTSNIRESLEFCTLNRRHLILSGLSAGMLAISNLPGRPVLAASPATNETSSFRIKSIVELSGTVHLKNQTQPNANASGKQTVARKVPIKSKATLDYDEQYQLGAKLDDCAACLYFHEATTDITVDRHSTKTELREQCREIVKAGTPSGFVTACPDNPLYAAERDLVEGSLNSMYLDQLLTDKEVGVTDKWVVDRAMACQLFNLDAVQSGKLEVCLVQVDKEKAQLEIDGELAASVRSVATQIKVKGKAVMDRKTGTISWFAANIEETREIGEAEPGFSIQAQIRVLRAPIESISTGLTLTAALKRMPNLASASLLQFQSDLGYYRFLADRRWSTYRDNGEEATLRFIVDNRLIAQCNVSNLVDFEAGRQLTLEGFQSEIQKLINSNGGELIDASERLTGTGVRTLRISANSTVEGVTIRWIHYHLSNDSGRRLSLAFTLNEEYGDLFGDQDLQIVGSFEVLNWPSKRDPNAIESPDETKNQSAGAVPKSSDESPKAKSSMLNQPTKSR